MLKLKHFILIVLALITVSFFAGRWSTSGLRSAQYDQISAQDTIIKVYQRELNGRDQTIYEKNQLLGTQREAIQAGILERDLLKATNIKKATQITQLKAQLQAAIDSIPISDTVFITVDNEDGSGEVKTYAQLPFSWDYSDQWILSRQASPSRSRDGSSLRHLPGSVSSWEGRMVSRWLP
jgi:hypothetical protein